MGGECGDQASDSMGNYRFGCKLAEAETVKHSSVCAEISAPAHSDRCEYGYGIAVDPAGLNEVRNQSQGSSDGS